MKKFLFVLLVAALALPMMAQKTAVSKALPFDRNSVPELKVAPLKAFDMNMHPRATMLRAEEVLYSWDFETDDQLNDWMIYDADGDGLNWGVYQYDDYYDYMNYANSGITALVSYSYMSGESLDPDNYLISPTVNLNGTLSFWTRNYSGTYPDMIAVYVCVGEFDPENLVKVSDDVAPGTTYQEVTVDLSQFAGQEGCFVIRHYNSYDQYRIYVDDVTITGPAVEMPVNVTVDPAATTAEVAWEDANNNAWNLRYREVPEGLENNLLWDFEEPLVGEDYSLPGGWTCVDADGDGNEWYHLNGVSGLHAHSGLGHVTSASYNGTALSPDNWLISPEVKLDGKLSFWACGQDPNYAEEVFAVYASTDGNNWQPLSEDITATGEMTEYTFDLTGCGGVDGYIAIRHYNCYDMFRLNVDDIAILYVEPTEWIVVENVNNPYTIEGLNPETNYEVEVQAINEEGAVSAWTAAVPFTTLNGDVPPVDPTEKTGAPTFNGYTEDGIYAYFVEINETEPSTIYYRVIYPDGTVTEWEEYTEMLSFSGEGKYRIEAYAVAPGKLPSDEIAYEFVLSKMTGVLEVVGGKQVANVRYFNAMGQEMQEANGMTIVVTTYTDGTTNTVKVMK
ncbi:MAG: choice-of-anchor J domain-containing protein [Muribaculaceae bacterium]|nr:choice-of-anchor J domain-containing protein [Muribaculaceae bacterium]